MHIAYLVSRFPDASETFVLRELNGVDAHPDMDIALFSLFPPKNPFVHPDAERWVPLVHRVTARQAILGSLAWTIERPRTFLGAVGAVIRDYGRVPRRLTRALTTCAVAAGLSREMRSMQIDRIHAHFATYPALAAWLCGRLLDVPYSFTAHAHDIYIDQLHLGPLVKDAAAVVVISDFNRRFLEPYGAGSHTPVRLVRCAVDPEAYAFRPRTPPSTGPIRAVCVATLNELKGHSTLLDALARGGPQLERVQLDLVGSGPLEAALGEQIRRLGLGDRVRMRGTLSERDVARLLDESDIFVLASVVTATGWMDGIPVALMEALASGLPVIASRLSGIPELIRDGETGVLARPGDAADLAAAFERVLADPDATLERCRAGRRLIEEEFAIERSASRMVELFSGRDARASRERPRRRPRTAPTRP